jgi:hypothetical protein
MNPNFLGIIVVSILTTIGLLLVRLKKLKDKAERLQKEQDVAKIKTDAKDTVTAADLDHLLKKLNAKMGKDSGKVSH